MCQDKPRPAQVGGAGVCLSRGIMTKGYKSDKRMKELSRLKKQEEKRTKRLSKRNAGFAETQGMEPAPPSSN